MMQQWHEFLSAQKASLTDTKEVIFPETNSAENSMYPLQHLAVLEVSGKDAAQLLQGQLTCNVQEVTEKRAVFAAMCNAKGRVIAAFLLVKHANGFLLLLPNVLLETVKKRLQMYVLRSVVTLTDGSGRWAVLGLVSSDGQSQAFTIQGDNTNGSLLINWPSVSSDRQLVLVPTDYAMSVWQYYQTSGFQVDNTSNWRTLDLKASLPWLDLETSEQFIPQMLNIDQLGGISFNKGCYTGQEIVARTHYLGAIKRSLFVAECKLESAPAVNSSVFSGNASDFDAAQSVGTVVAAQCTQGHCIVQIVLQLDAKTTPLVLADQTPLTLLS